jgi:hypothetical protein
MGGSQIFSAIEKIGTCLNTTKYVNVMQVCQTHKDLPMKMMTVQ